MNKLIIAFLFVALYQGAWAQGTEGSPYSFYGIGDPNSSSFSNYKAMGEAQTALSEPAYINLKNSASFAGLRNPTFAIDFTMNWLNIESPSSSQNISSQYINGVSFGFPIGKRFGAAFSVGPYTRIGYDITSPQIDPILGNYNFTYAGEGGYNRATGGIGGMPIKNDENQLMLGVQANYYFGFSQTSRAVTDFVDDATVTSSKMINRTNIKDLAVDFGILYRRKLINKTWISAGLNFKPTTNISATNQQLSYTYRPSGLNDQIIDTVIESTEEGNVKLPNELSAGLAIQFDENWIISFDYTSTAWSELQLISTPVSLSNSNQIAAGFQYIANTDAVAKFLQSIRYRGGFKYENTRLNFGGTQLKSISGTAGLGIPIQKTKMLTTFNFGIEVGSRGRDGTTLVKENFTNLYIGLSMNPHKFDGWFRRSKYN